MKGKKIIAMKSEKPKKSQAISEKNKIAKTKKTKLLIQKSLKSPPSKISETSVITAKKTKRYVMPSKVVTDKLVTACLNALQKLSAHDDKKKNTIFGDETQIFMEVRCVKILHSKINLRFTLPHSTVASSGEVCLITPDIKKGKKPDHEPTIDRWEEILKEAGVTEIKTVLPMRQLRVEYDQFELKRRLLTQHDFIMVDTRVLNHVSHILGKMFFKKHNMLIPVRINEKKDLKKNIDNGLHTSMLRLNEGQTSIIVVGHTTMPQEHVKENILAVIKQLKERFPGGEINIRSLSIKLPLSLSLPLYLTLRPSSSVKNIKMKLKKPKEYKDCEGELTTQLGIVQVAPDGTVHMKKKNKKDNSYKEEIESSENEEENNEMK